MKNKDWYTSLFLRAANLEITSDIIKEYSRKWWWNTRSKNHGGLRLTEEGRDFIISEADLKTFEIDLPKEYHPTAQTLIWLDQYLETPFYLNKRTIIVIEEKAAFELYLFSGDIRKLGYNRALNKRMIQD
jgi:hypothetical protein